MSKPKITHLPSFTPEKALDTMREELKIPLEEIDTNRGSLNKRIMTLLTAVDNYRAANKPTKDIEPLKLVFDTRERIKKLYELRDGVSPEDINAYGETDYSQAA